MSDNKKMFDGYGLGVCPRCESMELEQNNCDIEFQELMCNDCGFEFHIRMLGWEIVKEIKHPDLRKKAKRRFVFPMKTCYEIRIDANNIEDAMQELKERVECNDIEIPEYAQNDGALDVEDFSHLTKNKFDCVDVGGEYGSHISSFETKECVCGDQNEIAAEHCGCMGDDINGLYHIKLDDGWEEC